MLCYRPFSNIFCLLFQCHGQGIFIDLWFAFIRSLVSLTRDTVLRIDVRTLSHLAISFAFFLFLDIAKLEVFLSSEPWNCVSGLNEILYKFSKSNQVWFYPIFLLLVISFIFPHHKKKTQTKRLLLLPPWRKLNGIIIIMVQKWL